MTKNLNIPKAPDSIDIEEEQLKMAFIATCIEATARTHGVSYSDIYKLRLFTSTATHTLLMSSSLKIPHYNE